MNLSRRGFLSIGVKAALLASVPALGAIPLPLEVPKLTYGREFVVRKGCWLYWANATHADRGHYSYVEYSDNDEWTEELLECMINGHRRRAEVIAGLREHPW